MKTANIKSGFGRKLLSVFLAVLMSLSVFSTAFSAQAATCRTGNVDANKNSYYHVYTNGNKAKLRICTFNQKGSRTSGKLKVLVVSDRGATYSYSITGCNGFSNNTTNVTLPAGNTHYIVYVWRNGNSNSNITKTCYLSIDYKTNCWY